MAETFHVVGARPNFMKAAPVVAACTAAGIGAQLIHTGQHYDRELSQVFFDDLGMPEPDENLGVGSGSHAEQTAALMLALDASIRRNDPRLIVVYGDVNSTLAAAVVAAKLQVPLAHVEAGLRSGDRSMPEEINRIVTDVLASSWFVTAPEGLENLAAEGITGAAVRHVGNPMIDTLLRFRDTLDGAPVRDRLGLSGGYGVVTLHRPGNVDDHERSESIVRALSIVAETLPLVFPIHPRGRHRLVAAGLEDVAGLTVIDPLGYLDFMALIADARLVITDSGGIQEETTVLGVPCLTVRPNTERPITVTAGTNRLVEPDEIPAASTDVLHRDWEPASIPLWDGAAGERIAAGLAEDLTALR